MQRMVVMPPGAPQPAIDAIRKAIAVMGGDCYLERMRAKAPPPEAPLPGIPKPMIGPSNTRIPTK